MKESKIKKSILYVLLISIAILAAFPFVWMILSSFKEGQEFYVMKPTLFPKNFQLDNFKRLFSEWNFGLYYFNSIFITVVQVVGNVVIVLAAGYGFAKFRFKGRKGLFMMLLSSTMIPWVATIIPLYIMASKFGLIDTYLGLIIPGLVDAFSIFLARNFMSSIPNSLIEAARIDGAGEFKIFRKVALPLAKPLIAVISIQKMIASWNSFQWPLLAVNSEEHRTLPIAMSMLSSQYYDSYDLKMAAAVITIIPVLLIYIVFQKYFVEGISMSGIK